MEELNNISNLSTENFSNEAWASTIDNIVSRIQSENRNEYSSFNRATYDDGGYTATTVSELPDNRTTDIIQTTSRFSSAIWFEKIQEQSIILAGVGGIGSYVAFLLSRMQPYKITIFDPDTVEVVNMAGQLYGMSDIDLYKTKAIVNRMRDFSSYFNVNTYERRYDTTSPTSNIMICGFDNMEARRIFFHKWLDHVDHLRESERSKCLFIDGRLNAEEFQVLCLTGDNQYAINKYANDWLFSDNDVEEAVCSYKQTSYMANMIGSVMTNLFVNFCANMCDPVMPRDLPFLSRYDGTTMFFKTE